MKMEKDRVICLLYCDGCDAIQFYINGEYIDHIEHLAYTPDIFEEISKRKQHIGSEIYKVNLDWLDEEALEKFHNREDRNLTIAEEEAIAANDIEELQRIWREDI